MILRFQLARYSGISLLIQGLILLVIMLVTPQGIVGLAGKVRKPSQRIRPLGLSK